MSNESMNNANKLIQYATSGELGLVNITIQGVLNSYNSSLKPFLGSLISLSPTSAKFIKFICFNNNEALRKAAANGHLTVVIKLLEYMFIIQNSKKNHKLLRQKIADNCSEALRLAAGNNHIDVVCEIMQSLSKMQGITVTYKHILALAASHNRIDVVNKLLEYDVIVRNITDNDNEAFRNATAKGNLIIVAKLLEYNAVVQAIKIELCKAATNGHLTDIIFLLYHPIISQIIVAANNNEPLRLAVINGHISIVNKLLEYSAVVHTIAINNNEMLILAAENGHLNIVNKLLEYSDVIQNITTKDNEAFKRAEKNNHVAVVNKLLEYEGVIQHISCINQVALYDVSRSGNVAILPNILKYQIVVEKIIAANNNEPLRLAASYGHLNVVIELLKYDPVRVNIAANNNEALLGAAIHGHTDVIGIFLEDANVKSSTLDLQRIFDTAVSYERKEVANLLLEILAVFKYASRHESKYASYVLSFLDKYDPEGNLDIDCWAFDLIHCLINVGSLFANNFGKINDILAVPVVIDNMHSDAVYELLLFAAEKNRADVIVRLIQFPEIRVLIAQNNNQLLCCAAKNGSADIVDILLRCDEVLRDISVDGNVALRVAAENSNVSVVIKLFEVPSIFNYAHLYKSVYGIYIKVFIDAVKSRLTQQVLNSSYHDAGHNPYITIDFAYDTALFLIKDSSNYHNNVDTISQLLNTLSMCGMISHNGNELLFVALWLENVELITKLLGYPEVSQAASQDNKAIKFVMDNNHTTVINTLLCNPAVFSQAEKSGDSLKDYITEYVNVFVTNLKQQINDFNGGCLNENFDLTEESSIQMSYLVLRNMIRRCTDDNNYLMDIMILLNIPAISNLVASNNNELIEIAITFCKPYIADRLLEFHSVKQNIAFKNNIVLRQASMLGYADLVAKLLQYPLVQQNITSDNNYAFRWAIFNGSLSIVNMLLEYPAVVAIVAVNDSNALRCAVERGHPAIVVKLLEYPDIFNYALRNHTKYCDFLKQFANDSLCKLKQQISVFSRQHPGKPFDLTDENLIKIAYLALCYLIKFSYKGNYLKHIKFILAIPSMSNVVASNDNELIYLSKRTYNLDVCQWLLEFDAVKQNIAFRDNIMLREASLHGEIGLVVMLLQYPSVQQNIAADNNDALRWAAFFGRKEIVNILLGYPAVVEMIASENNFALQHSVERGHIEIAMKLLRYPAVFNYAKNKDKYKNHIIQFVSTFVAKLKQQQTYFNSQHPEKIFDLTDGSIEVVRTILVYFIENNCEDEFLDKIKLLLNIPLVYKSAGDDNNQLIELAILHEQQSVVNLLLECDSVIQNISFNNNVLFRKASLRGYTDIVGKLLQYPLVQQNITADNNEALLSAIRLGHTAIVNMLLEYPAVISMITINNNEALRMAVAADNLELIIKLLEYPDVFVYALEHPGTYDEAIKLSINIFLDRLNRQFSGNIYDGASEKFDLTNEQFIKISRAMLFFLIKTWSVNNNIDNINLLLLIPAIMSMAADRNNELLLLAMNRNIPSVITILMQNPAVYRLAEQNNYYRARLILNNVEMRVVATNVESASITLTSQEAEIIADIGVRYAAVLNRMGGSTATFISFKKYLEDEYNKNPATIKTSFGKNILLPLQWDKFRQLGMTLDYNNALLAYYQHATHTAYRLFLTPNNWMSPNARYVTDSSANFSSYIPMISLLWLAASDKIEPVRDGIDVNGRIAGFISSIALINRAHNWDRHRSIRIHNRRMLEEYDDLEGDKPSCNDGMKRRFFQSVQSHSAFCSGPNKEAFQQELKSFVYKYYQNLFSSKTLPELQEIRDDMNDSLISLELSPNYKVPNIETCAQQEFLASIKQTLSVNDNDLYFYGVVSNFFYIDPQLPQTDLMYSHFIKFYEIANLGILFEATVKSNTSSARSASLRA